MDWLGIGVIIIGIAFAILVGVLIKPINKLAGVLEGIKKTTDELPNTLTEITKQTTEIMQTSNSTLKNVNEQVHELTPFFHVIGDTGEATRKITKSALEKANLLQTASTEASDFTKREKYEGLFGILSFLYFINERRNDLKAKTKK
ncbi:MULTISPECIES: DUF948 domain-containing protein [Sporosarcina]|uniref:DUF948 domain-containing protein n=1 Tax=Sporosarcina contaminans TaxID=633403 RepID=A0ABW3TT65_9BACL